MSLSNSQYDSIMQEYADIRRRHREELEARRLEVQSSIPAFEALEQAAPDAAAEYASALLTGHRMSLADFHARLSDAAARKQRLLSEHGYPADYLDERYDCALCRDTGYAEGRRCVCFQKRIRDLLYEQSQLSVLAQTNNFERMREDFYSGDDLRRFRGAVGTCRRLISRFAEEDGYENILFFGPVGSGKSFLSVATAKEVIELGHSVLYFSAVGLFDRLSAATFDSEPAENRHALLTDLTECELLVIDDLGTELTNAFISTQLFHCINERHLRRHMTIMSTNLDFDELRARYSDRVFSRLMSDYTLCELTGSDIRLQKVTADT